MQACCLCIWWWAWGLYRLPGLPTVGAGKLDRKCDQPRPTGTRKNKPESVYLSLLPLILLIHVACWWSCWSSPPSRTHAWSRGRRSWAIRSGGKWRRSCLLHQAWPDRWHHTWADAMLGPLHWLYSQDSEPTNMAQDSKYCANFSCGQP